MSQYPETEHQAGKVDRVPERRIFRARTIQEIRKAHGENSSQSSGKEERQWQEPEKKPSVPRALLRGTSLVQGNFIPTQEKAPPSLEVDGLDRGWRSDFAGVWKGTVAFRIPLLWGLAGIFLLCTAYHVGKSRGRGIATNEVLVEKTSPRIPSSSLQEREAVRLRLDKALALSRSGDAEGGWKSICGLSREYPHFPSLAYAEALVALQAGAFGEVLELTKISISRGERVSDSLALQAVLSSTTSFSSGIVQEELLRSAVDADPMNPNPIIQLALFLSGHGQDEEAESLLQSAKVRLLPVDSHAVVNASLEILKFKKTPVSALPLTVEVTGIAEKDLSAAYAAMRCGDFQAAVPVLEASRKTLSPELFDYLLKASPLRDFAWEPKMTRFY